MFSRSVHLDQNYSQTHSPNYHYYKQQEQRDRVEKNRLEQFAAVDAMVQPLLAARKLVKQDCVSE